MCIRDRFIAYLDTVIRGVKESLEEIDGDIMVYADDLAYWSGDGERLKQMVVFRRKVERNRIEYECGENRNNGSKQGGGGGVDSGGRRSVSYTHLTLPTSDLV